MMLDGKLVLCSHSDATFSANGTTAAPGSRHYNGGISQLSIFDTSLSPAHVWALHNQVGREDGNLQQALCLRRSRGMHTVCKFQIVLPLMGLRRGVHRLIDNICQ